jgi:hypothetical protein
MKRAPENGVGDFDEPIEQGLRLARNAERYAEMRLAKLSLKYAAEHILTARSYLNEIGMVPASSYQYLLDCHEQLRDIISDDLADERIDEALGNKE